MNQRESRRHERMRELDDALRSRRPVGVGYTAGPVVHVGYTAGPVVHA